MRRGVSRTPFIRCWLCDAWSGFKAEGELGKLMSGYSVQGRERVARRASVWHLIIKHKKICWVSGPVFSCGFWVTQKSGSRHGVWIEGSSIHDQTWSRHLPSETGIPPHFLSRTKVRLRSLIAEGCREEWYSWSWRMALWKWSTSGYLC